MSKAIYKPKGKAGEYAEWACNLYVGCSNNCSYCYCKKGVLSHAMGGPVAKLKSCFTDERHAFEVFKKELHDNLEELQKSSLFFTFSSDPMIPETRDLNAACIRYAIQNGVRVQVLTKNAYFAYGPRSVKQLINEKYRDMIAFGFTLTGRDDMEPGASTNKERLATLRFLHGIGFRTFVSLEPVIDPESTLNVALKAYAFCDLFKVGLMSGVPLSYYSREAVETMVKGIRMAPEKVYLKRSLTDYLGIPREEPIDIFKIKK